MIKEINERVKQARELLKLSQVELATKIGIKQGTLSDIERKRINVSPKTVDKLTSNLGISLEWLYTGNGYIFIENNVNQAHGNNTRNDTRIDVKSTSTVGLDQEVRAKQLLIRKYEKKLSQDLYDLGGDLKDLYSLYTQIQSFNDVLKGISSEYFGEFEMLILFGAKDYLDGSTFNYARFKADAVTELEKLKSFKEPLKNLSLAFENFYKELKEIDTKNVIEEYRS